MPPPQRPVDLGIVVALPEELRELLALARPFTPHHDADLDAYLFERGPYRCAAALAGDMGQGHAVRVTERLITLWDPSSIVVVGVTGGVHDDLRVGDVHVPPQAVEYIQDAKAAPTAAGGFAIVPGPSFRQASAWRPARRSGLARHRRHEERVRMDPWIVVDPAVLGGKPCIKGTRISVAFILELLAGGASRSDILEAYPHVTDAGLTAALAYAARSMNNEIMVDMKIPA